MQKENSGNTGANFWAGETVENCAALFTENRLAFDKFFSELTEEKLGACFAYKNSKGTVFENTPRETSTHVFQHSGYHRGQAAQTIRFGGAAPPSTDFIQFLRRWKLKRRTRK